MSKKDVETIPSQMRAYVLRPGRHGTPAVAFQEEIVPTPKIGGSEVLVKVMAAGVNYNGVWAALGNPVSPFLIHNNPYHIAGSDAAGIICAIGPNLEEAKGFEFQVGDEVIIHCGQSCGICDECNGGHPMKCRQQKIWGYETPFGSFAQFTKVNAQQILPKPKHLSWAEAGSFMLTYATAWRMLFGFPPNVVQPGTNVLVWGGSGGLGLAAIQLIKIAGGNAVAITSNDERGQICMDFGAKGFINRSYFDCWGHPPDTANQAIYKDYLKEVRKFGKAIWKILGTGINPELVLDHIGQKTFPVSCYIVKTGGMVVFCGATSGFNLSFDASYVWMRQKRIQGAHFCSLYEMKQAMKLIEEQKITPCISHIHPWQELPEAHEKLYKNQNSHGNLAVLVHAEE